MKTYSISKPVGGYLLKLLGVGGTQQERMERGEGRLAGLFLLMLSPGLPHIWDSLPP